MKQDVLIIGGGIVGLATAYRILNQKPGLKLILIEKEATIASHQTGHNSGVIHSGIYYKPGSLKAINCITGYNMLLDFCRKEDVAFELCGKVIVATVDWELPILENIYNRGIENGLEGLIKLSAEEIKLREPYVNGIKGIFVPQTGIIDYKEVSNKYAENIQKLGGEIRLGERVEDIKENSKSSTVITDTNSYETQLVINCAGLFSDRIAKLTVPGLNLKIIPFRGEYYEIKKERQYLVKNLIYPVPDPNFPFLGVHFTRMVKGGVEAGPNAVLAFKREGYHKTDFSFKDTFDTLGFSGFRKVAMKYWKTGMGEMYRSYSKEAFTHALQKLLPDITEEDLVPGGAGVRAQACDEKGNLLDDFKIIEDARVINVVNAPSPAATSSLAIGQAISEMALKRFN